MRYNIGLVYVGNEAYVNDKFTLFPGQAVITEGELGSRLLNDFPEWFEQFGGVDDILAEGVATINNPYSYYDQAEVFDADEEDEVPPTTWEDDKDGADLNEGDPAEETESEPAVDPGPSAEELRLNALRESGELEVDPETVEPQTPEEQALEAAVDEIVNNGITEAVIEKLAEKSKGKHKTK